MKCLLKYRWVKLPRAQLPQGKGVLGYWSRLAARAAFRKGTACYCGYHNEVVPGMWSGGIVGLKSILGVRRRAQALQIMDQLQSLGYIKYSLDQKTKRLDYQICDWVISCSGQGCSAGTVYATDGYGFLCLPRNITQRLVKHNYKFEEADALLDLWCHTTWQDSRNAFSFLAPAVQFGEYGAVLTLEYLGQRWGWERTKVWRFFRKHEGAFPLYRLPGAFGCLVFNSLYPTEPYSELPKQADVERILTKIRIMGQNTHISGTDHARLCKMVLWYSRQLSGEPSCVPAQDEIARVAVSHSIKYAYFSLCWNCKNCMFDCSECEVLSKAPESFFNDRQDKEDYRGQTTDCRKGIIRTRRTADTRKVRCFHPDFDAARNSGKRSDQGRTDSTSPAGKAAPYVSQHKAAPGTIPEYRMGAGMFPRYDCCGTGSPAGGSDSLLGKMDLEMGLGNRKLESRLESVKKSRLLLDRVNEALTVLKRKPDNGPKMYELIYQTYLAPEKLSHADLLYRLDISSRHYYRLRQQAITILSIRLWSAPSNEVDSWLEILTLLESL